MKRLLFVLAFLSTSNWIVAQDGQCTILGVQELTGLFQSLQNQIEIQQLLIDSLISSQGVNVGDTVILQSFPGTESGQMIYWNGSEWNLIQPGLNGDFLGFANNTPEWMSISLEEGGLRLGCLDSVACNFDPLATVDYPAICLYSDACGVCDGPGDIYECGCMDIPEGDCDCDGNTLDALNVCGGTCSEDSDDDGICDDGDDCIGAADVCGVCNGPGAIYDCGCSGIPTGFCDCNGNQLDALGICGGSCSVDSDGDGICDSIDPCVGIPDSDGDGICDDVDDCEGEYDLCGVCNGPGPIYDCGCFDIPEGECDCAGNVLDATGNCPDFAVDTDGDDILDSLVSPCAGDTSLIMGGAEYHLVEVNGRCWFNSNLRHTVYLNGDNLPLLQDNDAWLNTSVGSACQYGDPEVYGLLYNWNVGIDSRNICPQFYSVPSREEWNDLISGLGGTEVAGGALKESGTSHWNSPNTGADNSSGMTIRPNGERGYGPTGFVGLGAKAMLWTSTSASANGAYRLKLEAGNSTANIDDATLSVGYALRCIRNQPTFGCTDINYVEYNPAANIDDGSCSIPSIPGCTQQDFIEYNPAANVDDGSCSTLAGCSNSDSLLVDGLNYGLVQMGADCWMNSNLRATHFSNGDTIPLIADPIEWSGMSTPGWSNIYNNPNNDYKGLIYNFYAIEDERSICPSGWHISTDQDWLDLESFIGMPVSELPLLDARGCDENLMFLLRQDCTNCTNDFGFNATLSGLRLSGGSYVSRIYWWTSTPVGASAYIRGNHDQRGAGCIIRYNNGHSNFGGIGISSNKRFGAPARCVRD
ncbi:MAG: fibrobacter succinogenes major paralogous domain-containing protein [Flavobacteriales bacterium]|nr:fibrobacter succinogenes major paralogous domain-containing protein [Flavobacteriales bacterium]